MIQIKVIEKTRRIGSQKSTGTKLAHMSAAAGRFNAIAGTKVRLATPHVPEPEDSSEGNGDGGNQTRKPRKTTNVSTITYNDLSLKDEALLATVILNDFDKHPDHNSDYSSRKSRFDTLKAGVLQQLNAVSYDQLTVDQKQQYAKRMLECKAPFSFVETQIHIRLNENQSVYSKAVRSIRRIGAEAFVRKRYEQLPDLRSKYEVTLRN